MDKNREIRTPTKPNNFKRFFKNLWGLSSKCLIAPIIAITWVLLSGNDAQCAGNFETIALTGQTAPEGGIITELDAPLINAAGQLVFTARLDNGDAAVLVYDPAAGDAALQQVAVRSSFSKLLISHQDRVAFQAGTVIHLVGGPSPFLTSEVVRRADYGPRGIQFSDVSLKGLSGAEGEFTRILFSATLNMPEGGESADSGLYLAPNAVIGGTVAIAVEGGEETDGSRFDDLRNAPATMSAEGLVVFAARLYNDGTTLDSDSALYAGHYRSSVIRLVSEGETAPGGGRFPDFFANDPLQLEVNSSGEVAFTAQFDASDYRIFRIRSGEPGELIVRSGTAAPASSDGNDGNFYGRQERLVLNDEGQVAFLSRLEETSQGLNNNTGIFRSGAGSTVAIVRENQAVSYLGWIEGMGLDQRKHSINNMGMVAFSAYLRGSRQGDQDDEGIFMSDGGDIEVIAVEGSPLGDTGHVVSGLDERCMDTRALNDEGKVAFVADLESGQKGVFLFTPEAGSLPPSPFYHPGWPFKWPYTLAWVLAGVLVIVVLWMVWRARKRSL